MPARDRGCGSQRWHGELLQAASAIAAHTRMLEESLPIDAPIDPIDLQGVQAASRQLLALVHRLPFAGSESESTGENQQTGSARLRHDLRNPINAIKGYGEMLLEDGESDASTVALFLAHLRNLLAAADHMLQRIDTLLEAAAEASDDADMAADFARTLAAAEHRESAASITGTILVVDDNGPNRDALERGLSRRGHRVIGAAGGHEALRRLETQTVDLVLLDLLMPDMNGLEVLMRLKASTSLRTLPVIVISALDQMDSVARCIEIGAEDYLLKPFDQVLLWARINSGLLRKQWFDREREYVEQLKQAQSKLVESEKMAALGGLVAGVSHEINTPVGNAVTASSHLRDRMNELAERYGAGQMRRADFDAHLDETTRGLDIILSNLERTHDLVQSFKAVAVDQAHEAREHFPLGDYLHKVALSLEPTLKATPHNFVIDCPVGITLYSYPGTFAQILTNLVLNSLTHAFDDHQVGQLRIQACRQNDQLRLIYTDNGKGIAAPLRATIFDPFVTTRRGQGGTGLGMHIVYNLVTQKLNGAIQCVSPPSGGACFEITVPLEENRA